MVGEYGRRWFAQRGIAIEESFHYTAQNPTLDRARHIAELLLERFDAGEISAVWVIYTDMKNGLEAGEDPADAPGALSRRRGGCRRG